MANLLEVYEGMLKQAEEQQLINERVEFLAKYASAAEELLQVEYPNNFTKQDVAELADRLIDHDVQASEMQEKTAALENTGREMAREYVTEMLKEAWTNPFKNKSVVDNAKSVLDSVMAAGGEGAEAIMKHIRSNYGKGKTAFEDLSTAQKVMVGTGAAAIPTVAAGGAMYLNSKK